MSFGCRHFPFLNVPLSHSITAQIPRFAQGSTDYAEAVEAIHVNNRHLMKSATFNPSALTGHTPAVPGEASPSQPNHIAHAWVQEMIELCLPSHVVWCDGSDQEKETLTKEAVKSGVLITL